jgi:L-lysine 2,3-aminomutase
VLITGGDGGYISAERFDAYVRPVIEDPALGHIKTIRLGTRVLTFNPEIILMPDYQRMLDIFRELTDNGIQMVLMSHFSTPRELMNPVTVAAIRRLRAHGVTLKSQSPIMNYISLYSNEDGVVDIDRSAQNWIDLGNLLAMLGIGFHSMYMARPTGEHHYFTQPLAVVNEVFSKVYRSLSSINRPSRYITMTSSAGKISMLGTLELHGEKLFALKFNEARNMEWMDKVYLARYDDTENTIANLKPYGSDRHFFEAELEQIESKLEQTIELTRSKKV